MNNPGFLNRTQLNQRRLHICVFLSIVLLNFHPAVASDRFEVAAWIDHFDWAAVVDTEKPESTRAILDHAQEAGATTILWRPCSGSVMRYPSKIESHHADTVIDKRSGWDNRYPYGWLRYGERKYDELAIVTNMCNERGFKPGVHWPYGECHYSITSIGRFNKEHPQYWCRDASGQPWWGQCSIAYEPVIEYKLALVDEWLERGTKVIFIEFWRAFGWSPAYEYVEPVMDSFRKKYGCEPPSDANDLRWRQHVSEYVFVYLRRLRDHVKASYPDVEIVVGLPIDPYTETTVSKHGYELDWRRLVDEGIIDTLIVNYVQWDKADPIGSTNRIYQEIMRIVNGRCRVLFPIKAYNFLGYGMTGYQEAMGKKQHEVAKELMLIAWETGAAGVSLEVFDHDNYAQQTRELLKKLATGKCQRIK